MKSVKIFIGIYLLISLVVLCVIPVLVFLMKVEDSILRTLVYVGTSGGIGGVVYSIRAFYQNLADNSFDGKWVWWYVFRPMISVVAGVFLYFLIVGGLMSISASNEVSFSKGIMFYCALAFLSGFSFTRFADKLNELSDTFLSKKSGKRNAEE